MGKLVGRIISLAVLLVIVEAALLGAMVYYSSFGGGQYQGLVHALEAVQASLMQTGTAIIGILEPVVQFGLVVVILLYAAQRLGFINAQQTGVGHLFAAGNGNLNIQAIIALLVIGAFSLSALTGVGSHVADLKEITLVVVGFYFGNRRRAEADADAAQAGAVAGAAVANALGNNAAP